MECRKTNFFALRRIKKKFGIVDLRVRAPQELQILSVEKLFVWLTKRNH